jgi:phospholipid-transporting ATPase
VFQDVVTGSALNHILKHEGGNLEKAFMIIARNCRSVIACRVSPAQKALIVRLVRRVIKPTPMTLAIGDGANDVQMIQSAQVGIGISGKEGRQAVNAADFAIAQFRFLKRLLFVHGRKSYRRMSKVVLYSFYKNFVITLCLFYFNALAFFSGSSFYESIVYTTFNFVLGLPIVFIGITDTDISDAAALAHPSIYAVGRFNEDLNVLAMLGWVLWAVLHSAIIFWCSYGSFANGNSTEMPLSVGLTDAVSSPGLDLAGFMQFNVLLWAMQLEVCLLTNSWTYLQFLMLAISMLGCYAFYYVYSLLQSVSPTMYGVALRAYASPSYWFLIVVVLGAILFMELSFNNIKRAFFPSPIDIAVELDKGYGKKDAKGKVLWGDEEKKDKTG